MMLNVEKLNVVRNEFDLSIEDLKMEKSGLFLVIGPNGGGKTTFLKSIAGLINYGGKISLDGKDLNELDFKSRAKLFAYLPQNIFVPEFLVKDFLITGRFPYTGIFSYYSKEDWDIVAVTAQKVDITRYMNRSVLALSQGELQRVMLAKVFIQSPKILLLDEPTNALDIGFKELIKEQIYSYMDHNPGSLVIISTHEPEFFAERASNTLMIKDGKLFKYGESRSVYIDANKRELFNLS